MKSQLVLDSRCASALRSLNALLDGELPASASAALTQHLAECPSCQQELEARKNMRSRLKAAVAAAEPSPFLKTRVMAQVRSESRKPQWMQRMGWTGAAAAVTAITVGVVGIYSLGQLRQTAVSQNAYIGKLLQQVSHVMRPGLADHVHCSVFRKYPKNPPAVETLHATIGPEYKALLDAVAVKVPSGFRVHIAHECGYQGRRVVHIGLHDGSRQISVVLAKREAGETFRNSGLLPVIAQGGFQIYSTSAERFQIAGLETESHLAYVVSDISDRQTRELMLALAPVIRNTLTAIEG